MNIKTLNTTPLPVIRKSNELIEARYRLSNWEQRLVFTLLTDVYRQDQEFKRYRIRVADFAEMWGLESDNSLYEKVQEAADSLLGKTVQLSDDPKVSEKVAWLEYVKYVRGSGVVEMEFHSSLKPYLLQLKNYYTEYQLGYVVNFKNQYTIRIYELLRMEAFKAIDSNFSRSFQYEELRVLLAISKKEYTLFGNFNLRVIIPSVEEICAHTDLDITEVRYGKTGRKVADITFFVKVRSADEMLDPQPKTTEEPPKGKTHPLIDRLTSLGFAVETASKYKTKYGVKRIERNIAYTLAKQQAGLVKNFPAYLNGAIKDDLGGAWEQAKVSAEEKAGQQKQAEQEKETKVDQAKKESNDKHGKAFANFSQLSEEKQEELRQGFLASIKDNLMLHGLYEGILKSGKKEITDTELKLTFTNFLIKKGF